MHSLSNAGPRGPKLAPGRVESRSAVARFTLPLPHRRTLQAPRRRCLVVLNTSSLSGIQTGAKRAFHNANFPVDDEGRTYHLGTKRGEVANRILSVGSNERAVLISQFLDPPAPGKPIFKLVSSRGFLTITGKFKGIPVSIVSTMMGMPNMDFVVRENRAVVDGQMAVIRLGTCGAVRPPAKLGCLLLASHGSICIRRDVDAFTRMYDSSAQHGNGNGAHHSNGNGNGKHHSNGNGNGNGKHHHEELPQLPYLLSLPAPADAELAALLSDAAAAQVGPARIIHGLNASADSFYSSQGRLGHDFDDHNEHLVPHLLSSHPELISLEMETFQLLDLARCSRGSIRAMGFCIALAERYSNSFMEPKELRQLESQGGLAALEALAAVSLEDDASLGCAGAGADAVPEVAYIWA